MFLIGGLSWSFLASSFCDFLQITFLQFHYIFFLFDKSIPLIFSHGLPNEFYNLSVSNYDSFWCCGCQWASLRRSDKFLLMLSVVWAYKQWSGQAGTWAWAPPPSTPQRNKLENSTWTNFLVSSEVRTFVLKSEPHPVPHPLAESMATPLLIISLQRLFLGWNIIG